MKPKNPFKLDGARPLPEKALDALNHIEPSRRDFLKTAGVMMIGFGVGAPPHRRRAEPDQPLGQY